MMAFLVFEAASSRDAHERSLRHASETFEFLGDLISAQLAAAQQGKSEKTSFNNICLHYLT